MIIESVVESESKLFVGLEFFFAYHYDDDNNNNDYCWW